nr:MAG TPA: hypothetical protein [Caudoviricetes sp.]
MSVIFSPFLLFRTLNIQNPADALDDFVRFPLSAKNLVEVRIVKEQSCVIPNSLNQFRLLHTSLKQLHLYFKPKIRPEVFFQNSTSIC